MDYKKNICVAGFLFCVLLLFSCDPKEAFYPSNRCFWIVKNTSNCRVIIQSELSVNSKEKSLNPGESYTFDQVGIPKEHAVYFGILYDSNVIDDIVEIKNEDDTKTLKIWRESEKDNQGRQFLSEEYWTKREWKENGYNHHEWTFELLQEDIE